MIVFSPRVYAGLVGRLAEDDLDSQRSFISGMMIESIAGWIRRPRLEFVQTRFDTITRDLFSI